MGKVNQTTKSLSRDISENWDIEASHRFGSLSESFRLSPMKRNSVIHTNKINRSMSLLTNEAFNVEHDLNFLFFRLVRIFQSTIKIIAG